MKKIKVVYYNIDRPNKNNRLYPKDLLDNALYKFCEQDFWIVERPDYTIDPTRIVGKVIKSEWTEHDLIFYINLYEDRLINIEGLHFCLFGEGDVSLDDINNKFTTVKNFNIVGMFIADNCAWDDGIEVIED